ncbi:hypothetical protein [Micromonospora sp. KC213]|uniref:hypothetical protein n=1 Tax=Micromonospora sp. KC213 TaxID=2530378 RepID=UPI0014051452|nr:hypothetical protein [Micromonospora sp. KC213]
MPTLFAQVNEHGLRPQDAAELEEDEAGYDQVHEWLIALSDRPQRSSTAWGKALRKLRS